MTYENIRDYIDELTIVLGRQNGKRDTALYMAMFRDAIDKQIAMIVLNMEDFGKSVFLTREEAETALAASIERIEKVRNKE